MDKLKFWVGLAGAVVTALLDTLGPDGGLGRGLVIASAVLTAVAVYAFPNEYTSKDLKAKLEQALRAGR